MTVGSGDGVDALLFARVQRGAGVSDIRVVQLTLHFAALLHTDRKARSECAPSATRPSAIMGIGKNIFRSVH